MKGLLSTGPTQSSFKGRRFLGWSTSMSMADDSGTFKFIAASAVLRGDICFKGWDAEPKIDPKCLFHICKAATARTTAPLLQGKRKKKSFFYNT